MAVTIGDIARHVGVAQSTISTVLNNAKSTVRVSDRTRKRVLDAASRMNYRPSFTAQSLARGKTFTLGMVVGSIDTPYFSEMADIALRQAESHGYHLLISVTEWNQQGNLQKELDCIDMLMRRQVDGLMVWPGSLRPGTKQYEYIIREKFPVVSFAADNSIGELVCIDSDYSRGMHQAVEHLRLKGCATVGFIGKEGADKALYSKRSAFLQACDDMAMPHVEYDCPPTIEGAHRIGRQLARRSDRPDAVIVFCDYMAMGIIGGASSEGLDVPKELAVIGIDNVKIGEYFKPAITTIDVDKQQMIMHGLELLLAMIDGKEIDKKKIHQPTNLVVRKSG